MTGKSKLFLAIVLQHCKFLLPAPSAYKTGLIDWLILFMKLQTATQNKIQNPLDFDKTHCTLSRQVTMSRSDHLVWIMISELSQSAKVFSWISNATCLTRHYVTEKQMCSGKPCSVNMCAVSMKDGGGFGLPGLLTDLQLSLNASLAALPVVRLRGIVFWHHLDKLTGQCGVLEIQWGTTKHFTKTCSMAAVDTNLLGY